MYIPWYVSYLIYRNCVLILADNYCYSSSLIVLEKWQGIYSLSLLIPVHKDEFLYNFYKTSLSFWVMLLQSYTLTWSAKSLFQPTIGTSKYKALIGKSLKRSITHPTVKHRLYNWLNVIKIKHFQSFAILKSGCRRGTLYFLKDKHCVFVDPLNVFRVAEVLIDVLLEFSKRFLKLGNSV
jgi:mRNA-degrading endonuclease HigB of HigAB toxin-antitoxin module